MKEYSFASYIKPLVFTLPSHLTLQLYLRYPIQSIKLCQGQYNNRQMDLITNQSDNLSNLQFQNDIKQLTLKYDQPLISKCHRQPNKPCYFICPQFSRAACFVFLTLGTPFLQHPTTQKHLSTLSKEQSSQIKQIAQSYPQNFSQSALSNPQLLCSFAGSFNVREIMEIIDSVNRGGEVYIQVNERKPGRPPVEEPPDVWNRKALYIITEKVEGNQALVQYYSFESHPSRRSGEGGYWQSGFDTLHPVIKAVMVLVWLMFVTYALSEIFGVNLEKPFYYQYKALYRQAIKQWSNYSQAP